MTGAEKARSDSRTYEVEDVKKVEVDGSNEEVEPDGEAEKSAGSEVLTGAERT